MTDNNLSGTLLVVAHPDDEAIWFTSVLVREQPVDLVVVTCGADAVSRSRREAELGRSAELFGVRSVSVLHHPDDKERRLDLNRLRSDLAPFRNRAYRAVYTHSPMGETFESKHHQDVSYIVHQCFRDVWSVSWNQMPERTYLLNSAEFRLKQFVVGSVYWKEYAKIRDAYQVSCVECFTRHSREAVEIFYWGVANFGDNHEYLSTLYPDCWGYADSPYEIERHERICRLIREIGVASLTEVGAAEGKLTARLAALAIVRCVEPVEAYRQALVADGRTVVEKNAVQTEENLILLAAVLEYMTEAEISSLFASIRAMYVITDTIPSQHFDEIVKSAAVGHGYRVVSSSVLEPRWEEMFHGGRRESLDVYKEGSTLTLWRRL